MSRKGVNEHSETRRTEGLWEIVVPQAEAGGDDSFAHRRAPSLSVVCRTKFCSGPKLHAELNWRQKA
jgi:hypothetical protein